MSKDYKDSEYKDVPEGCEVKPFVDHLEDLRWVIIKSLIVIFVASIVCFSFSRSVMNVFYRPLLWMERDLKATDSVVTMSTSPGVNDPDIVADKIGGSGLFLLKALHPAEGLIVSLKVSFYAGLILASPFVLYFIWDFVRPALRYNEKRIVTIMVASTSVLFTIGVVFCYFVVLRLCLYFFWGYTRSLGIEPSWTVGNYLSFVGRMLLAFGIAFELPVVSGLLARLGIINASMLRSKRGYGLLFIFILAAVLTPPDVFSQILLALPLILLYELSIFVAGLLERKENLIEGE